jgi:hypothetical protein
LLQSSFGLLKSQVFACEIPVTSPFVIVKIKNNRHILDSQNPKQKSPLWTVKIPQKSSPFWMWVKQYNQH